MFRPAAEQVVEVGTGRRRGDQEGFGTGRQPSRRRRSGCLESSRIVVDTYPKASDTWQRGKTLQPSCRDQGPHGGGSELWYKPDAQCSLNALGNAETGCHFLVIGEL